MNEFTNLKMSKYWKKVTFFTYFSLYISITFYDFHLTVDLFFMNEANHQYSRYCDSNRHKRLLHRVMKHIHRCHFVIT